MSATTHIKLGLFAIAVLAGAITAAAALGIRAMSSSTVEYHTYFDESVQGLELGSPVMYRGVNIGAVADISIAPDRKHVDVELALRERDAMHLRLTEELPELRTQLANQGVTGLKFIDIDFFDPRANPPTPLPFAVAANYIPARPSLMKGIETNLEEVGVRLPDLFNRAGTTLDKLGHVLDDVHDQRLAVRFGDAVDRAGLALGDMRRLVRHVDDARLPAQAATALRDVDATISKADNVLARVDGDSGLIANARRATQMFGDLGRSTIGSTEDLAQTIREVGEAARAIRELIETIDRDPDMLVKGRARSGKP
jgi:paraquat-inducible protein B